MKTRSIRALSLILGAIVGISLTALGAPKKKATPPAVTLEDIEAAIGRYDFDGAYDLLDEYRLPKTATDSLRRAYENVQRTALMGQNMLERVERVAVADSFVVDAERFYEAYRRMQNGYLGEESLLPGKARGKLTVSEPVYLTDDKLTYLWAGMPENGEQTTIYINEVLADGSVTGATKLTDYQEMFPESGELGTLATPYLMSDGMTLYFAADGENSLGGLDIFMTRRDEESGKFLQPTNMGMPYNSPSNDYMMAIDEISGWGYWASDRGCEAGSVKVYLFRPTESRVNYSTEEPSLRQLARLDSLPAGAVGGYSRTLPIAVRAESGNKSEERVFVMPDGRRLSGGGELIGQWRRAAVELESLEKRLEELRASYGRGNQKVGGEILKIEKESLPAARERLKNATNAVVTGER